MKKRLWLIAAVLMCTVMAVAVSAETDGYYTYEVTDGEATITEVDTAISGDVVIPDTLGGYPVTVIGEGVFVFNDNITKVTVPDTVQNIGAYAFHECSNLTEIILPDGLTVINMSVFMGCANLASIDIPDSVTLIDEYAFMGCDELTSILLPDNLESIGANAFALCGSLTEIIIPASVENIETGAFSDCKNLTTITVNENNTCYSSLDGVLFNKDISALHTYPAGIAALNYSIPDGVVSVLNNAFSGHEISNISIPASVTKIEDSAFTSCSSLSYINVDSSNQYFSSVNGVLFSKDITILYKYPPRKGNIVPDTTYVIPESVTSIGNEAFSQCWLTSITLPEGLIAIGNNAFESCFRLTNITFPESLTSIGDKAFYSCDLTNVSIPKNVSYIGKEAFSWCSDLTSATILNPDVTIGSKAFYRCSDLTIYGYIGSTAETYANENSIPFVALDEPTTRDITLAITTYGDAADVTIQLLVDDEVIRTETVPNTTGTASYTITGVAPGDYTIRVSKPNHVSRSYSVTIQ